MHDRIFKKMQEGVESSVFPGGVLLIADHGKVCFHEAFGWAQKSPTEIPMDIHTVFDLASLTKPLATASAIALLVDRGMLSLSDPVSRFIAAFKAGDKRKVMVAHLLTHCSGLPDWRPYYEAICKRDKKSPGFLGSDTAKQAVYAMAHREPLVSPVGTKALYSDIGFILLGEILEKVSGSPLDRLCHDQIFSRLRDRPFFQRLGEEKRRRFAATEDLPWRGGIVCGRVHDENSYVMGGVSGHAGLFGSARAVYAMVQWWQKLLKGVGGINSILAHRFVTRYQDATLPMESPFGLGWDTPSLTHSSAGTFFSRSSFGHLGFTGTSLWVDPEKERVVILLTNRVHPSRNNDKIKQFRPELHDLIAQEMAPRTTAKSAKGRHSARNEVESQNP